MARFANRQDILDIAAEEPELTAAMRAALDLTPANLAERVAGLRVIRERWWQESLEQLTAALERLGFRL